MILILVALNVDGKFARFAYFERSHAILNMKYDSREITLNAILITVIYPPPARRRDVRLDIEAVQLIVN